MLLRIQLSNSRESLSGRHCERREAIQLSSLLRDGLLRCAMTAEYNFVISPHVSREVWPARSALLIRGRGECRASDAPASRVCK
jgi:hypothetical protein